MNATPVAEFRPCSVDHGLDVYAVPHLRGNRSSSEKRRAVHPTVEHRADRSPELFPRVDRELVSRLLLNGDLEALHQLFKSSVVKSVSDSTPLASFISSMISSNGRYPPCYAVSFPAPRHRTSARNGGRSPREALVTDFLAIPSTAPSFNPRFSTVSIIPASTPVHRNEPRPDMDFRCHRT